MKKSCSSLLINSLLAFLGILGLTSNLWACDKSSASIVSQTNNNNGTFTYVINVCREYLGLEDAPSALTFTFNCGVTVMAGFSPATYSTSSGDIYTGVKSGSTLTYTTTSPFIAHNTATLCGNFTITTSGYPTSISINTHPGYPNAICTKTFALSTISVPTLSASPTSVCLNGNTTLSASSCTGGNVNWYDVASGGTSLNTGTTYTTPALTTAKTYYASCSYSTGGCPSGRSSIAIGLNPCILPLELLTFEGTCINHKTHLFWELASNIGGKYFVIEKSDDGQNFYALDSLQGNNIARTKYSYIDASPASDEKYYRIVQVDINGERQESLVIKTTHDCQQNGVSIDNYSYNRQNLEILVSTSEKEEARIMVINMAGKVLYSETLQTNEGFNQVSIPLQLPPSLYMINVSAGGKNDTRKVLIDK